MEKRREWIRFKWADGGKRMESPWGKITKGIEREKKEE